MFGSAFPVADPDDERIPYQEAVGHLRVPQVVWPVSRPKCEAPMGAKVSMSMNGQSPESMVYAFEKATRRR